MVTLLSPQAEGAKQAVTLGTYSLGGQEVAAAVPSAPGPIAGSQTVVSLDGVKYLVDGKGCFVRAFRAEGGWSEVREGYAAAKAAFTVKTTEWRVKALVLPRSDRSEERRVGKECRL